MHGPEGEDNCTECGLFWMYHKTRRPLGVGVGVAVIGPKRETPRGPRIMDSSRKRRMGSVATGSGSDSEEEQVEDKKAELEREESDDERDVVERNDHGFDGDHDVMDMDMDPTSSEPEDDSPISLLNLTVLARKVQRNPPPFLPLPY